MSVSDKNRSSREHIVKSLAELATLLAGNTLQSGDTIVYNGVGVSVFSGASAPTSATQVFTKGDIYYDITNDRFYKCNSIVESSGTYTFGWEKELKESDFYAVRTALDTPCIPIIPYNLPDQSATFPITLPSLAATEGNKYVHITFKATAAFTPTVTATGSEPIRGETMPACESGKYYSLVWLWHGSYWEFHANVM